MNLLPARMKPLPDELLSSWIMRLAMAHGLKLQSFCDLVFGRELAVWNRDPDKLADKTLLKILAVRTDVPIGDVYETTLAAYAGRMYEHHNPHGNTNWLMPLGVYHRRHLRPGLQFCPRCLSEDLEPYYRRLWRVSWATVCTKHRISLLDCCLVCHHPVNFHRNEMGRRNKFIADSMIKCANCRSDLTDEKLTIQPCLDLSNALFDFQMRLENALTDGWFQLTANNSVFSIPFFNGFRQLVNVLAKSRQAANLLFAVLKDGEIKLDKIWQAGRSKIEFDSLSLSPRQTIVTAAGWLLTHWSRKFVEICSANRIWSSILLKDCSNPPFWYWQCIYWELYRPSYQPSEQEVLTAIEFLEKRGEIVLPSKVSRLLGKHNVFNKRGYRFCDAAIARMKIHNEEKFPLSSPNTRARLAKEAAAGEKSYWQLAAEYKCNYNIVANLARTVKRK